MAAEDLVFVDESGASTAMTRTRGRAPRGERVIGRVPQGHWKTLTMLGAVRLEGLVAGATVPAATVPAATDTPLFKAFVAEALVPALREGDVVVWDNLAPHRAAGLEELVGSAGGAADAAAAVLAGLLPDRAVLVEGQAVPAFGGGAGRAVAGGGGAAGVRLHHRRRLPRLVPRLRLLCALSPKPL